MHICGKEEVKDVRNGRAQEVRNLTGGRKTDLGWNTVGSVAFIYNSVSK